MYGKYFSYLKLIAAESFYVINKEMKYLIQFFFQDMIQYNK